MAVFAINLLISDAAFRPMSYHTHSTWNDFDQTAIKRQGDMII